MYATMSRLGAQVAKAIGVAAVIGLAAPGAARAEEANGAWVAGDFHQHTLYTDGATPFDFVMSKSNEYGLDWWANSEHGGGRITDGNGKFWDAYVPNPIQGDVAKSGGHQVMWRWQSLRDFAFADVVRSRALYPDKAIFSGLEWNVPGHEHCSTGIVGKDASAISAFEAQFDRSDDDLSRVGEVTPYGTLAKRNGKTYTVANGVKTSAPKPALQRHQDAVAGCAWMQQQLDAGNIENGWIVFAHVERAGPFRTGSSDGGYNVEHFRDLNDAGPDVCFGFEGAPGHQVNEFRGLGNTVTCTNGACTSSDFGGTYGGVGFYSARVGGLWDALLGEGRRFFNFASSDYHRHWTNGGGDDFYPGEYQKDWVFAKDTDRDGTLSLNEIADGMRSGQSFFVEGDLVDRVELTAWQGARKAAMGETLAVDGTRKNPVKLKIRFHSPAVNHAGATPVVDHVDLIAGRIAGPVAKELSPGVPNPQYSNPTNPTAKVIASFSEKDWEVEPDGTRVVVVTLKDLDESTYFRLRGTNLACGTPNETGPAARLPSADHCSPLPDALAGPNDAQKAFADLWFYTNPIFVNVAR